MRGPRGERMRHVAIALILGVTVATDVRAQAVAPPTFDVVSIKRNTTGDINSRFDWRPDGGVTIVNLPLGTIVAWAYPEGAPTDFVDMPAWAGNERYDVSATSLLPRASDAERTAMLRAMLVDRFKLSVRVEKLEQPVYDLVLARADGRLGPGITRSDVDCEAKQAADRAAAEAAAAAGLPPPPREMPRRGEPLPSCITFVTGPKVDAEGTIDALAQFLRGSAGRVIVNKTGLKGSYRVSMEFDRLAGLRGPDTSPGAPSSLFTAVQEQLGLKLEPARAERDTFIIERLERPTEN